MLHDRGIWALSTKRHGCARVNRGHGGCTTQRWIVHLYGNRRPQLHNPPPTIPQFASVAPSPHARFPLPDVLSRSFHNRCFHAIDTKPKDLRSSLVDARDPYDRIITHIEFVFFFFGSVGFDRAFILFFKRGTIVTLE